MAIISIEGQTKGKINIRLTNKLKTVLRSSGTVRIAIKGRAISIVSPKRLYLKVKNLKREVRPLGLQK